MRLPHPNAKAGSWPRLTSLFGSPLLSRPTGVRMVRFSLILGALLCTAISAVLVRAAPGMTNAQKRQAYRPYVAATTDCLARAIRETPAALQRAREGAWMEAVRLAGHHCDPVAGRMIFAHDELYGSRTGQTFFHEAYAADLPAALAMRLQLARDHIAAEAGQHARERVAQVAPFP